MNKIKEKIWCLNEDISFSRIIIKDNDWLLSEIESNRYEYGHAIYINYERPDLIIGTIFSTTNAIEIGYIESFKNYLNQFDSTQFKDVLFALDSYWISNAGRKSEKPSLEYNFKPHPIIDDFLSQSRGILLWHHQLENLYLFYNSDRKKAVQFRKDILKKKADAFDFAKNIKIDSELTALDIINERMLPVGTISPSFKEAVILYKYLNKS